MGGLYHEVQRLAREASPSAVQRLIELAQLDRVDEEGKLLPLTSDADHRVVMMASSTLIERGFGKPRDDYDPKADEPPRPRFNPALYTSAQLQQIEAALRIISAAQLAEAEAQAAGEPAGKRPMTNAFARDRGRSSSPPSAHERSWSR